MVALLVVGGGALFLRRRHHHEIPVDEPGTPQSVDRWRGFAAGRDVAGRPPARDAGAAGANVDWFSADVTPDQVQNALAEWHRGIQEKRAELVLTLDQAFTELPGRYGPALMKVAETDPDERVRAFSTRVLGKMKNVALVEDFQRLLQDKSPFVRQNAAWALGEIVKQPGGREAALAAADDLRQAQSSDPASAVRAAATNTLKVLQ